MSEWNSGHMFIVFKDGRGLYSGINESGTVRPVINVYKSALENNNN